MGSDPMKVLSAAFLASSTAFSLPEMLECAGTHIRSTLFVLVSQHSGVSADLKTADKAFKTASLSEHMNLISLLIMFGIQWLR